MAKIKKTAKAFSLRPRLRIQCGPEIAFGPGKADLLEFIAETGSIVEAAKRMDMSYMRAWSLVRAMNDCFTQPVVTAIRGGNQRGGAALTATGRRVLDAYRRMEKNSLKAVRPDWQVLKRLLHS